MRWLIYILVFGMVAGCTKAPEADKRSTYNCEVNPSQCNGGIDPTSAGGSLEFTVPSSVVKNQDFDISWGVVPGATTFDLTIANDEACDDIVLSLKDVSVYSQKLSMPNAGTFYACLDAKNSSGVVIAKKQGYTIEVTSSSSDPGFVAPSNLRISADSASGSTHASTDDDTTIYFIWDGASDSKNEIKSYSIKYFAAASCLGSVNEILAGTSTSYTFSSASFTSTYSFLVVATNNKNETKESSCSSSTTINYPVHTITFDTPGNYTYDNTLLSVSGGVATLIAVTQTYDDNSAAEFGQTKAMNNVVWDTDHLELKNAGAPDPRPLPNDSFSGIDSTNLELVIHFDDPVFGAGDYVYADQRRDAIIGGSSNQSVKGKVGRAWGGSSGYISMGDVTALRMQDMTVMGWIKTSSSNDCNIIKKDDNSASKRNYRLHYAGADKKAYFRARAGGDDGAVANSSTMLLNDNKWHHLVGVINGTNSYLFIDGKLNASDTHTGALHEDSSTVNVGLDCSGSVIDEVAAFSRALSATEIATLYQNQVKNFTHEHWTEAPGLMDGNVLLLHMDETSGNLVDYSGLGNNSTSISGSPSFAQTGKVSNAISFDGSADYFEFGDKDALSFTSTSSKMTVSAWIYADSNSNNRNIVSKYNSNANKIEYMFLLDATSREIEFWVSDTGASANNWQVSTANNIVSFGQWHHVAATLDVSTNTIKIYVDGVSVPVTNDFGSGVTDLPNTDEPVRVGAIVCSSGSVCNFWDGSLDEVAIWNRALSPQEIQTIYNLQSGNYRGNVHELPNDQDQTVDAWFPMNGNGLLMHMNETSIKDSGTNPSVYDYSGNGNNGTFDGNDDGAEKSVAAQLSKGLVFDGTDDHIQTTDADSLDLSNFTIGGWVKINSFPADNAWTSLVAKGGVGETAGNNHNYAIGFTRVSTWCSDVDSLVVMYEDSSGTNTEACYSYESIATNQWHHIVGVHDATADTLALFVNGIKLVTNSSATLTPETNAQDLYVGYPNATGSIEYFNGTMDEIAIWNRALSEDEIRKIFDHQSAKYSGTFTSDVIDTGTTSASWTALAWNMIRPYGKELGASSDLSSSYTALPNDTLMNGNVLLMHFNETTLDSVNGAADDVEDFSGQSNHGDTEASMTVANSYRRLGKFGYAMELDGTNDYVDVGNGASLQITSSLTVSAWVKLGHASNTDNEGILCKWIGNDSGLVEQRSYCLQIEYQTSNTDPRAKFNVSGSGTFATAYGNRGATSLKAQRWYHLVGVYESGNFVRVYVDGVQDATDETSIPSFIHNSTYNLSAGVQYDTANSVYYFNGLIDEVAVWNRALSLAEIQELYRRGASRIRYKVRSCDASGCDDESWIIPDNTLTPYSSTGGFFSELHNTTTSNPSLTFGGFGSHTVSNNQFFQWKAYLDTSDTAEIPELKSVTVGPTHYYGGNPTIVTSNALSFSSLISFTETSSVGAVKYQLSNDGGTTWYWYNSGWTTTTSNYAESSSATDINTNISSFPVGTGSLKVKAFLNSSAAALATSLENVSVQYAP